MSQVIAVIPTWNRTAAVRRCLRALAAQTRPVDGAIVIDNASDDDVFTALSGEQLPFRLGYLRLERNTGSSGGFAAGVDAALAADADWVWIQDNDGFAAPRCLELLLASARQAPDASVLAPQVLDVDGDVQGQHRGFYRRGHTLPVGRRQYSQPTVRVDYTSFIGMLVAGSAISAVGGPDSRFFVWVDDLEWSLRLGEHGPLYLVTQAHITHDDGVRDRPAGILATVRTHLSHPADAIWWRYLYAFRNSSWLRQQRQGERKLGWSAHYILQATRMLIVGPYRWQGVRLLWMYGQAGRHGIWGHIPAAVWQEALGHRGQLHRLDPRESPDVQPWMPIQLPTIRWIEPACV